MKIKKLFIMPVFAILILFPNCMFLFQQTELNPPSWIQGVWYDYSGNTRIEFTYDNVIVEIYSAETDYKYNIESARDNGETPYISETSTSNEYSFSITWDDGFADANTFEYVDSETIMWSLGGALYRY